MKQLSKKLFSKKVKNPKSLKNAKSVNKLMNKIFLSLLVLTLVTGSMSGVNTSFADTTTIGGSDITINSDTTLTGDSTGGNVTVTGGSSDDPIELILDGVTIDLSATGDKGTDTIGKPAIKITSGAAVKIILADGTTNILKGGYKCAGLQQEGLSLEITGNGALTANGGEDGAGIGGGYGADGSNITISSGNVTATGGEGGAGIGGGSEDDDDVGGDASNITISGGTVSVTGGDYAYGIGGGLAGNGSNITISGGNVTVNGGKYGAGIGCSNIRISGGTVTAKGGVYAAGIGGRSTQDGTNITISGGIVTAIGGVDAEGTLFGGAGIGGGDYSSGVNIIINGGTVTAEGTDDALGIGHGGAGGEDSFSTTLDGNEGTAIIYSNTEIGGKPADSELSGIFFEHNTNIGTMYGNPEIDEDVKLKTGKSFEIPNGRALSIASGTTFINNGTITNEGNFTNKGTFTNNDTFTNNGTALNKKIYSGTGTLNGTEKLQHEIRYHRNRSNVDTEVETDTKEHEQNYTVKTASHVDINFTRTGYSFEKWTTNQDGTGAEYCTGANHTTNTSYATDNAFDLYAQWTINQYTISFDKNGGTGTNPSDVTRNYQSNITLPDDSGLSKTGYSFAGWNTMADGTGTNYSASSTYNINHASNKTLYAKWKINKYTISFDKNGAVGTTSPSAITDDYNSNITLPTSTGLSKTGYSFAGWNTMSDGTGTNYSASDNYTINHANNKTLYAKWKINKYTISFDKNGAVGTTSPSAITDDYNTTITLPTSTGLSKIGYSFAGWNTMADGTGTNYPASSNYTINHANDKTLYAKWKINKYTISFDKNGAIGNISPSAITADYNSNITLPTSTGLSKTGYSFAGWNTMADGTGTNYSASSTYNINHANDKTLYAKWKINKYTISFDKNGAIGTTSPSAIIDDYNSNITLPTSTGLNKTGYSFAGWNTMSDGTGTNYPASSTYNISHASNKTLYAKWKINKYTISFDKNGAIGTTSPSAITDDYNSNITLPTSTGLSKYGYDFVGWNTMADGTGTNYPASSNYTINHASDKTLYASWSNKPYYILTYNVGTGGHITSGSAIQSVIQGTSGSAITVVADSGYEFSGWSDGRKDNPRIDTNVQNDITVDAIFKKDNITSKRRERTVTPKKEERKIIPEKRVCYKELERELKQKYPDRLVINCRVFTDVAYDSWYAKAVKEVVKNNIMSGTSETTFSPKDKITMGMVSTMLYSMVEHKIDEQDSTQPKVWYEKGMNWAKKINIIPTKDGKDGKIGRLINATEVISREQLILTLYNFAKKSGYNTEVDYELTKYIDAFEISKDAIPAMKWAVQNGLIVGTSENTLSPKLTVDRAQLSIIFMNFDNMLYGEMR